MELKIKYDKLLLLNEDKNQLLDFILANKNISVYCEKHNKKIEYLDTHQNRLYCEDCLDIQLINSEININNENRILDYCIDNEIVMLEEWKEWY